MLNLVLLEHLIEFLDRDRPIIICIQEIVGLISAER